MADAPCFRIQKTCAGPRIAVTSTQGIDVGAKAEIYELILQLAQSGRTILLNTLEIPELQKVADRCVVFYEGRISKILGHSEIDEQKVMLYATGAAQQKEGGEL